MYGQYGFFYFRTFVHFLCWNYPYQAVPLERTPRRKTSAGRRGEKKMKLKESVKRKTETLVRRKLKGELAYYLEMAPYVPPLADYYERSA
jgi:hypothetical protein